MKNLFYKSSLTFLAVITLFLIAASAANAQTERELSEQIPEREKQLSDGCEGARVTLEIDFASFKGNAEALTYVQSQGLEEIPYAFIRYCTNSDNTSEKDARKVGKVKSKIKKVIMRYVPKPSQKKISLQAGGVLLIEEAFGESGGTFYQVDIQLELNRLL